MNERDELIISKMADYCLQVQEAHLHFQDSRDLFFDKRKGSVYRNAVTMPILQIGELAKHLSSGFVKTNHAIKWRDIIRMRDFFAHHYSAVDYEQVWDTSHNDVQELLAYLEQSING